jgi:hypothetical protein
MNVDLTAAARRADPEEARAWLIEQRVFISSAMADTAEERRAVAEAVELEGARAVLFEELGRDARAGEAYLTGVDSATIYVGILNEVCTGRRVLDRGIFRSGTDGGAGGRDQRGDRAPLDADAPAEPHEWNAVLLELAAHGSLVAQAELRRRLGQADELALLGSLRHRDETRTERAAKPARTVCGTVRVPAAPHG